MNVVRSQLLRNLDFRYAKTDKLKNIVAGCPTKTRVLFFIYPFKVKNEGIYL